MINIKNSDNKCFRWCHIRHLNPLKLYPEIIIKTDKNMVNDVDYEGIEFTVFKKDFGQIEKNNNIYINVFCYENNLVYPVHITDEKFENFMDLLMIADENKSLIFKLFGNIAYNVLIVKEFWYNIKKLV